MKKIKLVMVTLMIGSMVAMSSSVSSQTSPDSRAETSADPRTTETERYDGDNDMNYSWVGLLGLIGLVGLRRKNKDVRDTSSQKFNS